MLEELNGRDFEEIKVNLKKKKKAQRDIEKIILFELIYWCFK